MIKMPDKNVHIVAGAIVAAIVAYAALNNYLPLPAEIAFQDFTFYATNSVLILALGFFVAVFYSDLPDIDHQASYLNNQVERILTGSALAAFVGYFFLQRFLWFIAGIMFLLMLIAINFMRHRGAMHSIGMGLMLALPFLFADIYLFLFAIAGWMTHLALDHELKFWA